MGTEIFCHPAWKRHLWTALTLGVTAGTGYVWFVLGGGTEIPAAAIWGLFGCLFVLFWLDRSRMDSGARVILSDRELRYEPGGILCKWLLLKGAVHASKSFRREQWRFEWIVDANTRTIDAPLWETWAVKAIPLHGQQRTQLFRLIADMPQVKRLRQLTDSLLPAQANEYSLGEPLQKLPLSALTGRRKWFVIGFYIVVMVFCGMYIAIALRTIVRAFYP